MKIKFDIKYKPQIESGEYIVKTQKGDSVKILIWPDNESDKNYIVAKLNNDHLTWFDVNGINTSLMDKDNSLILIVPGPKPTEVEIGLMDYVRLIAESKSDQDIEDLTRDYAKYLISVIKRKLLKNIPSWHTSQHNVNRNNIDFIVKIKDTTGQEHIVATNRLGIGEEFIEINDLVNFPKNDEE